MSPVIPSAGTLYWRPIDSPNDRSQPLGEASDVVFERAATAHEWEFSADQIEAMSRPFHEMTVAFQLVGTEARRVAETILGIFTLDPKWRKDQRRAEVAQRRIGQQMRHVRQRAARRARRAA